MRQGRLEPKLTPFITRVRLETFFKPTSQNLKHNLTLIKPFNLIWINSDIKYRFAHQKSHLSLSFITPHILLIIIISYISIAFHRTSRVLECFKSKKKTIQKKFQYDRSTSLWKMHSIADVEGSWLERRELDRGWYGYGVFWWSCKASLGKRYHVTFQAL